MPETSPALEKATTKKDCVKAAHFAFSMPVLPVDPPWAVLTFSDAFLRQNEPFKPSYSLDCGTRA